MIFINKMIGSYTYFLAFWQTQIKIFNEVSYQINMSITNILSHNKLHLERYKSNCVGNFFLSVWYSHCHSRYIKLHYSGIHMFKTWRNSLDNRGISHYWKWWKIQRIKIQYIYKYFLIFIYMYIYYTFFFVFFFKWFWLG